MKTGLLITMALSACILASARDAETGILSSPRSAGVSAAFLMQSGTVSAVRCYADIYNVIGGDCRHPGIKIDYHLVFHAREWKMRDGVTVLFKAGPGVAAGYVHDFHKDKGLMAGLSGIASIDFRFRMPVVVSVGMSGILGVHITGKSQFDNTLTAYRNGLAHAWIPEIGIRYRFR